MLIPDDDATRTLPVKGAVAVGKTGQMYLVDRDNLAKFDPSGVNHVQDIHDVGSCFCGPTYFEGTDGLPRIVSTGDKGLEVWRVNKSGNSIILAEEYGAPEPLSTTYFQKGFFTSVSSNDHITDSAIIWAIRRAQKGEATQSLILHAFDAKDGEHLCAADAGPWPQEKGHGAAPNAVPVVANGKVFIASYKELRVFGVGGAAACGVKVVAETHPQFHAALPVPGQSGVVKGIIVDVVDAKMHLNMGGQMIEADVSKVLRTGRHGNINRGKPITIQGTSTAAGSMSAESIYSGD
jgi:hypothetical protein